MNRKVRKFQNMVTDFIINLDQNGGVPFSFVIEKAEKTLSYVLRDTAEII